MFRKIGDEDIFAAINFEGEDNSGYEYFKTAATEQNVLVRFDDEKKTIWVSGSIAI